MPQTLTVPKISGLSNYAVLRRQVKETLLLGQRKIEEAKVLTYWNTGRLINGHLLAHKERADYGSEVVRKLSEDLEVGKTVLWRCVQFARTFPIVAARRQLAWAHYRTLITVGDDEKRSALAKLASDQKWPSRELEIRIRDYHSLEAAHTNPPAILPVPKLGPFYTYRVIRPELIHSKSNDLLIDLGFSASLEASLLGSYRFKPDTIVTSLKDKKGAYTLEHSEDADWESLFTYKAHVERVIDGDTLKVEIDLGFKLRMRQTIRLKGIDSPEMDTSEGKAAKKFVEEKLKDSDFITIKTLKSDKYDRYLGDVFYMTNGEQKFSSARNAKVSADSTWLTEAKYLNNELLAARHAVRM